MVDWEQIVRANSRTVINAAYRLLGNLADAEDVAQEVFIEAHRKWSCTKGDHNWSGLLKRIAVCRALDLLRAHRATDPLPPMLEDACGVEPIHEAVANELEHRLRAAIAKLPLRESEVVCLALFEQTSNSDIAEMLGIPPGAVAVALSKARKKLSSALGYLTCGEIT